MSARSLLGRLPVAHLGSSRRYTLLIAVALAAIFVLSLPGALPRIAFGPAAAAVAQASGQSRCATVEVEQTVSQVGEKIMASAKRGEGWSKSCGPTWAWGAAMPVGKVISGCGKGDSTCVIQTSQPTGGALGWCITGVGGLGWGSCDTYVVILKGQGIIEGYTKDSQGNPVSEVIVDATGNKGTSGGISGTDGFYALAVAAGSYKVAATRLDTGGKATFAPASLGATVRPGAISHADFTVLQQNALTISIDPAEVAASGVATVAVTITDTSPEGQPESGATIVVEPPVEVGTDGIASGILCNADNGLTSPVRLHDGTLLGRHVTAITNSSGQITFTLYVGTVSGNWEIEAYQPGNDGAPPVSESVNVTAAGGRLVLDPQGDLVAELISQGSSTLTQQNQNLQRNLLEWLGEIDPTLASVGLDLSYAPIYAVDASGKTNAGVVLFSNNASARRDVLDYLDGLSTVPPPEDVAVVVDVPNMLKLLQVGKATHNLINHIPYRLPSLGEWANGTKIQITQADVQAFGNTTSVPIPARGRPHFGLVDPHGNEDMLYGYGPYLPAASTSAAGAALEHCVS